MGVNKSKTLKIMKFKFTNYSIDYYDQSSLHIYVHNELKKFNRVRDLHINKEGIEFEGSYIPDIGEMVYITYGNNLEHDDYIIYYGQDTQKIFMVSDTRFSTDYVFLKNDTDYIKCSNYEFAPLTIERKETINNHLKSLGYEFNKDLMQFVRIKYTPELQEDFWYVGSDGSIYNTPYSHADRTLVEFGNCFKNRHLAEIARDRIRIVLQIVSQNE